MTRGESFLHSLKMLPPPPCRHRATPWAAEGAEQQHKRSDGSKRQQEDGKTQQEAARGSKNRLVSAFPGTSPDQSRESTGYPFLEGRWVPSRPCRVPFAGSPVPIPPNYLPNPTTHKSSNPYRRPGKPNGDTPTLVGPHGTWV